MIYIPFKDLEKFAQFLDDKTLKKQIEELSQILINHYGFYYFNITHPKLAKKFKSGNYIKKYFNCPRETAEYGRILTNEYFYRFREHSIHLFIFDFYLNNFMPLPFIEFVKEKRANKDRDKLYEKWSKDKTNKLFWTNREKPNFNKDGG